MNRFKQIKDWLLTCDKLGNYIYFNVLSEDIGDTALTSDANVSNIVSTFNNGAKQIDLYFNVSITKSYSTETSDVNLDAMEVFEQITEWIEEQDKLGNYPDFGSDIIESVEPAYTNADVYVHDDNKKCSYVAKYKIRFTKL